MTYDLEIMLRHDERVFTEHLTHEREVSAWTAGDVDRVLRDVLRAINRVQQGTDAEPASVNLRGLSWIVSPFRDGVVIALEIHSASAVAGPFSMAQDRLERLIAEAIAGVRPTTVH